MFLVTYSVHSSRHADTVKCGSKSFYIIHRELRTLSDILQFIIEQNELDGVESACGVTF